MTVGAGVLRDEVSLEHVAGIVDVDVDVNVRDVASHEVRNLLAVARVLVASARAREESRGTHTRLDFPEPSDALVGRFVTRGGTLGFVPLPAEVHA
jgi:succinate dehydrogenase/fumarate reductase flavoprotein subunit